MSISFPAAFAAAYGASPTGLILLGRSETRGSPGQRSEAKVPMVDLAEP